MYNYVSHIFPTPIVILHCVEYSRHFSMAQSYNFQQYLQNISSTLCEISPTEQRDENNNTVYIPYYDLRHLQYDNLVMEQLDQNFKDICKVFTVRFHLQRSQIPTTLLIPTTPQQCFSQLFRLSLLRDTKRKLRHQITHLQI